MNNFKSQKTSLARTTLGLVCAQKSNRLIRYLVFVVMAVGLTACGGGGSSSGGGSVVATITYTGSYRTQFYNGSITIQIPDGSRPVVTITGVQCITQPLTEEIGTEVNGGIRVVSATITELTFPGNFNATFPDAGGVGTISLGLSRDSGCTGSSDGEISVARS